MIVSISYDAHKVRKYDRLYALMASWNAVRVTDSHWLANLVGPAETVRDIVGGALDNDDTVVVIQLQHGSDWATVNANTAANAALSAYVTPSKYAA